MAQQSRLSTFLTELKRRRVFREAAFYGVSRLHDGIDEYIGFDFGPDPARFGQCLLMHNSGAIK